MTEVAAGYVARERLVSSLLAGRVGLVEAGAGFGKSVLATQFRRALGVATVHVPLGAQDGDPGVLVSSFRRALRSAKLSDLLAAAEVGEPAEWVERLLDALVVSEAGVLVVLDDAHHLVSADSAGLAIRLARGLPAPHRLLITARSLVGPLEGLWALEGAVRLDSTALAFTTEEAAELIGHRLGSRPRPHDVRVLVEATQGWATALVLAAGGRRMGGTRALVLPSGSDLVASPLRGILRALGADDRRTIVQLAHLPLLSADLCDVVGGGEGSFERIVAAGIPITRTESGWWELPSPVVDYLVSQAPLADASVLAAAEIYVRHGEVLVAVRALLTAGLSSQAAATLADVRLDRVEDLGFAVIRDLVERLPEAAIGAHPRVLLHLARIAETAHQADLRAEVLATAAGVVPDDGSGADRALRREIDAERARDLLWDERTRGESESLANSVIAQAGNGELVARARALDVLGRLASWFSTEGPRAEAETLLAESARLARRVGQRTWAAQALIPLAMGVYFGLCRFGRALAVLDDALADLPARNRYRVMVLSFRADVLFEVGRFAEAESCIAEMREIGRWCREEWALAYASWGEANLASYQGDRARVVRAVLDVERHRDVWYDQASGVEFLSHAADCLDRVGEHELAREYLARAHQRMRGFERPFKVYGAAVAARSGDPAEADRLIGALLADTATEPQERWPLLLLGAHVALRRGREAGAMAAEAFDMCRELGHPEGPLLRERVVAEKLLPLAAAAGSPAAAALLAQSATVAITLLGGFAISRGGHRLKLPPGQPAKAVRALAVMGGRMHADVLMELLWPDVDPVRGRNRLRNLLSRLRVACPELLERKGELITLSAGCDIDTERFDRQARDAMSARASGDPRGAVILARSALERYGGELLPDDRYEEWTATARERLRASYLQILDLLAADAERRAEIDEAARLIQRAIDAQPYDEERYLRLARLLASQGRAGSALDALRRCRDALIELGPGASESLEELDRALRSDSAEMIGRRPSADRHTG